MLGVRDHGRLASVCVVLAGAVIGGCAIGLPSDATPTGIFSSPPAVETTSVVPAATPVLIQAEVVDQYQAWLINWTAQLSAREDLKAIMNGVDQINQEKARWREAADALNRAAAELARKVDDGVEAMSTLETVPGGMQKLIADPTTVGQIQVALETKADLEVELKAMRADLEQAGEMDEEESLRLQRAMDQLSTSMSTLSNLLTQISDTANAITHNIK